MYVYILKCNDGSYYTGVTANIEQRLQQHFADQGGGYVSRHKPFELVYREYFEDALDAIEREKQIKKWNRKKKEALTHSDWNTIHEESKCRNRTHFENLKETDR